MHAIEKTPNGIHRDNEKCNVCGKCVEVCPSGAMEMLGEEISVDELVAELVKDRAFFEKSGGGITLSGGEPSLQPAFTLALIKALKSIGLSVAIDTCGMCQPETLEQLASEVDIILFDLKVINQEAHKKWTGVENERILENLQVVKDLVLRSKSPKRLWIRTPLIPKATDSRENIQGIGSHLAKVMGGSVDRWDLCAFNNLCRDKYARLGMEWQFADTPLMSAKDLAWIELWAKDSGFDSSRIFVTGATRVEINDKK